MNRVARSRRIRSSLSTPTMVSEDPNLRCPAGCRERRYVDRIVRVLPIRGPSPVIVPSPHGPALVPDGILPGFLFLRRLARDVPGRLRAKHTAQAQPPSNIVDRRDETPSNAGWIGKPFERLIFRTFYGAGTRAVLDCSTVSIVNRRQELPPQVWLSLQPHGVVCEVDSPLATWP